MCNKEETGEKKKERECKCFYFLLISDKKMSIYLLNQSIIVIWVY